MKHTETEYIHKSHFETSDAGDFTQEASTLCGRGFKIRETIALTDTREIIPMYFDFQRIISNDGEEITGWEYEHQSGLKLFIWND